MENPVGNPETQNAGGNADFWEVLDLEGLEFDIEEQNVEIRPENAVMEAQIENEGRTIDFQKLQRRIELENRKAVLREHEIREKAKKYYKTLDAVISRFGRDNEVLLEALYWKEKLRSPNQPIGVLEDFVKWIEPLIYAQNQNEAQNQPEPMNKAQKFLQLLNKATEKRKKARKGRKTEKTENKATTTPKIEFNARFRLYVRKGTKMWLIYTDTLQLERLKEFKATQFDRYVRIGINGVYLTVGDFIAIPIKKDELTTLKALKPVLSLTETIRAIETIRQKRAERRRIDPQRVKSAVIGFYRLFGHF